MDDAPYEERSGGDVDTCTDVDPTTISQTESHLSLESLTSADGTNGNRPWRYFNLDVDRHCTECGQLGHTRDECAHQRNRPLVCYFCGERHSLSSCLHKCCPLCGHNSCDCKKALRTSPLFKVVPPERLAHNYVAECYRCGGKHSGLFCPLMSSSKRCKFCFREHMSEDCPELYKQKKREKIIGKVCCFNCGSHKHYWYECQMRKIGAQWGRRFRREEMLAIYNLQDNTPNSSQDSEEKRWTPSKGSGSSALRKNWRPRSDSTS